MKYDVRIGRFSFKVNERHEYVLEPEPRPDGVHPDAVQFPATTRSIADRNGNHIAGVIACDTESGEVETFPDQERIWLGNFGGKKTVRSVHTAPLQVRGVPLLPVMVGRSE